MGVGSRPIICSALGRLSRVLIPWLCVQAGSGCTGSATINVTFADGNGHRAHTLRVLIFAQGEQLDCEQLVAAPGQRPHQLVSGQTALTAGKGKLTVDLPYRPILVLAEALDASGRPCWAACQAATPKKGKDLVIDLALQCLAGHDACCQAEVDADGGLADAQTVTPAIVSRSSGLFSNELGIWSSVEDQPLRLEPRPQARAWLLFSTARVTGDVGTRARLLINGDEHAVAQTAYDFDSWTPWQQLVVLEDTTRRWSVDVQLQAGEIDGLQLVALSLAGTAELWKTEETSYAVPSPGGTVTELSFVPSSPGRYLVLAAWSTVGVREASGDEALVSWVRAPSGEQWPQKHFVNWRDKRLSHVIVRLVDLSAEQQIFRIEARGGGDKGGHIDNAQIVAVRADAFRVAPALATALTEQRLTDTKPTVLTTLDLTPPPEAAGYVLLRGLRATAIGKAHIPIDISFTNSGKIVDHYMSSPVPVTNSPTFFYVQHIKDKQAATFGVQVSSPSTEEISVSEAVIGALVP